MIIEIYTSHVQAVHPQIRSNSFESVRSLTVCFLTNDLLHFDNSCEPTLFCFCLIISPGASVIPFAFEFWNFFDVAYCL